MREPQPLGFDPAKIVVDNHNALVVLTGDSVYAPRGGVMRLVGLLDQGASGKSYVLKCPVLHLQEKGQPAQPHLFVPAIGLLAYLRDYLSGAYLAAAEAEATAGGAGPEPAPLWLTETPEDAQASRAAG